jgi:hypothetical protein
MFLATTMNVSCIDSALCAEFISLWFPPNIIHVNFRGEMMNRRDFLRANRSVCAGWALSRAVPPLADPPSAGEWRTSEVVTNVVLLKPDGVSHIWLPAPQIPPCRNDQ